MKIRIWEDVNMVSLKKTRGNRAKLPSLHRDSDVYTMRIGSPFHYSTTPLIQLSDVLNQITFKLIKS